MMEEFLARDEGKTLEFKENCRPLQRIVRTAVAFANTAGGTIVIGVKDKTKAVVGLADPLADEERLASAFADGIRPLLVPDVQIHAWRNRQLIVVTVPHAVGPYYVRSEGTEAGVYVRLGSTNRPAGPELVAEIRLLARNIFFDERPCSETNSEDVDFRAASEFFAEVSRPLTPPKLRSLGLVVGHGAREVPTIGAVLLFGKTRRRLFPSATAVLESEESPSQGVPMRRDDEVEAIAMDVTMRYERSRGWTPVDVSGDGEHYDIRSEGPRSEKRFIEVKGRAQTGAIILTGPELDKLRQLTDRAWLYIVTLCKEERPRLRIIQNPIPQLSPEMLYRQVQFVVAEKDWVVQGQEVTVTNG